MFSKDTRNLKFENDTQKKHIFILKTENMFETPFVVQTNKHFLKLRGH